MGCFTSRAVEDDKSVSEDATIEVFIFDKDVELLPSKTLGLEFNDTMIKLSVMSTARHSPFSKKASKSVSRGTVVNAELSQVINFKIGNEVLCMSWNLHHRIGGTPFDCYCNFRSLRLSERDSVTIEIIWDVARVFLLTDNPSKLCSTTILSSIVPSALLNEEVLDQFCSSVNLSEREVLQIKKLPSASLLELLNAYCYNEDINQILCNDASFFKTHLRSSDRESSPLALNYNPEVYKDLLKRDPSLLPVLILDCLHVLIIKFSWYLVDKHLRKAFSEFEPEEQVKQLSLFCKQLDQNDLTLPANYSQSKVRLYNKWAKAFTNENKVKQIWLKADQTNADIILLQRLSKELFKDLVSQFAGRYSIVPSKFPSGAKETTAILLRTEAITVEKNKQIRRIDDRNFAVLCNSSDIRYYVGVVHLTEGDSYSCGEIRNKQIREWKRVIGRNTPVIIGGDFNEDLAALDSKVAQSMLKTYNGIDHTQEESLAMMNRTRTNLQFEVAKSDKLDSSAYNGVFSSFPLFEHAFTDFTFSGKDNPSDHAPIFQRIKIGLF